jgi:hypothetical protein
MHIAVQYWIRQNNSNTLKISWEPHFEDVVDNPIWMIFIIRWNVGPLIYRFISE